MNFQEQLLDLLAKDPAILTVVMVFIREIVAGVEADPEGAADSLKQMYNDMLGTLQRAPDGDKYCAMLSQFSPMALEEYKVNLDNPYSM